MNIMGSQGAAAANNPSTDYSLSRQGSLYSLTLDEFQTQLGGNLGKPLSNMNLDELLRTVWIAESNNDNNGSSSSPAAGLIPSSSSPPSPLHTQSSLLLPRDLSAKTVDQVWREINNKSGNECQRPYEDSQQQQRSLGEMTLEDFLSQAGVIGETAGGESDTNNANTNANCGSTGLMGVVDVNPNATQQHCQWIHQYPALQTHNVVSVFGEQHHQVLGSGGGGGGPKAANITTTTTNNNNLIMDSANNISDTAPLSPPNLMVEAYSDTYTPARKRVATREVMVVERRQKRMIKNRESAARSRARKQAYTNELENKVSRLEEENKRLRRMQVKVSTPNLSNLEVEKVLPSLPTPPDPKCRLRRTNSGPL